VIIFWVFLLIILSLVFLNKKDFRIWYLDLRKVLPLWKNPSKKVEEHYEKNHEAYLKTYGNIIQAHRTETEEELLNYIAQGAQLKDGQQILDAGCGFGGPSSFFAERFNSKIEAITLSKSQVTEVELSIQKNKLKEKLNVKLGDFHELPEYYQESTFDRVLFLESLGHAESVKKVIQGVFKVLKPGGLLYIKDFVKRDLPRSSYDKEQIRGLKDMAEKFRYNTLDIYHIIYVLRKEGFDLVNIKEPDFKTDNYEVNRAFVSATGIVVGNPESFGVKWKYEYPPFVDPVEFLFQKRNYKI
jgi:2-polyprenyl-3-methyl-5-hydroxy-6-metoxy-1,4-benzoquinol methylase